MRHRNPLFQRATSCWGIRPLHCLFQFVGDLTQILWRLVWKMLLSASAKVNALNDDGETALMLAAQNGYLRIVEVI